jgi:hypothetical protein
MMKKSAGSGGFAVRCCVVVFSTAKVNLLQVRMRLLMSEIMLL